MHPIWQHVNEENSGTICKFVNYDSHDDLYVYLLQDRLFLTLCFADFSPRVNKISNIIKSRC